MDLLSALALLPHLSVLVCGTIGWLPLCSFPLFSCRHQINNLRIKGVIERTYRNAFTPCALFKRPSPRIHLEATFKKFKVAVFLFFFPGKNVDDSSRFVAVSTLQEGECIALVFFLSFSLCVAVAIHTQSPNWRWESVLRREEDSVLWLRAGPDACEKKRGSGGGLLFSAELLSSPSRLLSSLLDEPLMRSFTGGEKKARGNGSLLGGGVDEIITQLSQFLSGQRLVPV